MSAAWERSRKVPGGYKDFLSALEIETLRIWFTNNMPWGHMVKNGKRKGECSRTRAALLDFLRSQLKSWMSHTFMAKPWILQSWKIFLSMQDWGTEGWKWAASSGKVEIGSGRTLSWRKPSCHRGTSRTAAGTFPRAIHQPGCQYMHLKEAVELEGFGMKEQRGKMQFSRSKRTTPAAFGSGAACVLLG